MSDTGGDDYVVTERAAYVVYLLMCGKSLSTTQIANELNMTYDGAWRLMQKVSRRVPLRQDLGYWFVIDLGN